MSVPQQEKSRHGVKVGISFIITHGMYLKGVDQFIVIVWHCSALLHVRTRIRNYAL